MATLSHGAFRFLSLCALPPGSAASHSGSRLSRQSNELMIAAEQHGVEALVLAHIERTGLAIPADLRSTPRQADAHAHGGSPEGGAG